MIRCFSRISSLLRLTYPDTLSPYYPNLRDHPRSDETVTFQTGHVVHSEPPLGRAGRIPALGCDVLFIISSSFMEMQSSLIVLGSFLLDPVVWHWLLYELL